MAIPNFIFQAAFAFAFLNTLLVVWTLTKIVHAFPGLGSKQKRHEYSIAISSFCFNYLMLKPCPWMRIHGMEQVEEKWKEVAKTGTPYILANHNSKIDSLLITGILPLWLGPKMRSLIKEALFNEPLFGGICAAVGHFPVYYKGTADGDFGVNKEAQAKVSQEMDDFIGNGGGFLIFPEGQLNKTPRALQTLRRGAFSLPIKHKRPIWALLNVGCDKAWPHKSAMGGFPCDIYLRIAKVTDDASKFDNASLAEFAGSIMQTNLDEMHNEMENKKLA